MVIDCITFYNELELLEIRLEELKEVVDWFVVVEGQETFTGKRRPYVFADHRQRFERYPILYLQLASFPAALASAWDREAFLRNTLACGLQILSAAPNDAILLSDADELPRAEVVSRCARDLENNQTGTCYAFDQTFYYFYLNCRSDQPWLGTRMTRYESISTFQALRMSGGEVLPRAGWHFSYLGGPERIQEKLGAFSHTEYDTPEFTDQSHIESCLVERRDLFGREIGFRIVPLDESFPRFLLRYEPRFRHLLAPHRA